MGYSALHKEQEKIIVEHVSVPYKLSKRGKWLPLFFVSVCVSDCCNFCICHSKFLYFVDLKIQYFGEIISNISSKIYIGLKWYYLLSP